LNIRKITRGDIAVGDFLCRDDVAAPSGPGCPAKGPSEKISETEIESAARRRHSRPARVILDLQIRRTQGDRLNIVTKKEKDPCNPRV